MELLDTIAISFSGVVFILLLVACCLMVRDTIRQKGCWAINLRPPKTCPKCDTPAPLVRIPKNRSQALWGGCTCTGCGCEYDRWGEPVEKQPFPAKWSAKLDDSPAATDRIKRPSIDIERKGDYRD